MKRVIIFLTALVVLFGLVGCATDDMQKEINENKANISEVEKSVSDLKTQMGKLDSSLNDLGTAKTEILGKIDALEKLEKKDLEEVKSAIGRLSSDLNNVAKRSELEAAVTQLQLDMAALASDFDAELSGEIDEIAEQIATLATAENLEKLAADVAALGTSLTTAKEDLVDLAGRVATLETGLAALQTALTTAQTELATKADADTLAALSTAVATLKADVDTALAGKANAAEFNLLKIKVDELTTDVEHNADAVRLSEYRHATAVLAADDTESDEYLAAFYPAVEEEWNELVEKMGTKLGDIEFGDHKAYSYNAWMDIEDTIAGLEANYPADRYQKLVASINAQRFFLGRDVTTDEIKARFAELAEVISELPTLEELFIEGVTELNEVTIYMLSKNLDAQNPVRIYADNDAAHEAEFNEVVFLRKTYLFLTSEDYTPMNAEALEEAIEKFENAQFAYQWLLLAYQEGKEFNDAVAGRKLTTAKNAHLGEEDKYETYSSDLATLNELNAEYFGIDVAEEDIDDYLEAFLKWCPEGYSMETLFSGLTATVKGRVDQIKALREAEELFTTNELGGVLPGFAPATATYQFNGTNFNKVNGDYDAVLSWASTNKVDDDNRDYIYFKNTTGNQSFADATLIDAYVDGLNAIYAEKVTATEMIAKVTPTQALGYYVEYSDKEELLTIWKLFGDLKKAVNDFVVGNEEEEIESDYGYGQTIADADYAAMLAKAELNETHYKEKVVDRLTTLDALVALLAEQLALIDAERDEEGKFSTINLNDYDPFFLVDEDLEHSSVRETLDDLYDSYDIAKYVVVENEEAEELTHNAAMSKAVEQAYFEMGTAYNEMAAELAEAVETVNNSLTPAAKNGVILYADNLNNVNLLVGALIKNYGINNQNIHVHVALTEDEEAQDVEVNFSTLADNIAKALANVATKASKAQAAWEELAAKIAAAKKVVLQGSGDEGELTEDEVLDGFVILHLDDFTVVNNAYNGLANWALEFLNPGIEFVFEYDEFAYPEYEGDPKDEPALIEYNNAKGLAELEYEQAREAAYVTAVEEYIAAVKAAMIEMAETETFNAAIVELVKRVQTTKNWAVAKNLETGKVEVHESDEVSTKYVVNGNEYHFFATAQAEHIVEVKEALDEMLDEAKAEWNGTAATEEQEAVKGLGQTLAELADKVEYAEFAAIGHAETNADTVYKYFGAYTGMNYTFSYHDKAAYDANKAALKAYVEKYYRSLNADTQLMHEFDSQEAFNKAKAAYDLFYTDATADLATINEKLEAVDSEEAYKLVESQLADISESAYYLKGNANAKLQELNDYIANWNALYDNQEEDNCYEMFYRYNTDTNYKYAILRTTNMCNAVELVFATYIHNVGVINADETITDKEAAITASFTELNAVYDQYIRLYSYNETLASDSTSLNDYFNTFVSKVESMNLSAAE